jgi:cell division protein FtsA
MGEALRLRVNNEIPAYRTGLVAALDVGTSKVACVIGRAEQGSLKILGSALRESAGLRAGTVTSLDLAE